MAKALTLSRFVRTTITMVAMTITMSNFGANAFAKQTFYVSKAGSDQNLGTSETAPLRTFAAAAKKMRAGDYCLVMAGVYHQTLKMFHSGRPGKPITFEPYRQGHVVIDAANQLTHWQLYKGNIYSASMLWNLGLGMNQVLLDGKLIMEARYPEETNTNPFSPGIARVVVLQNPVKPYTPFSTIHILRSKQFANMPTDYFRGAVFVGQVGVAWSTQGGLVTHSSRQGWLRLNQVTKTWWFGGHGHGYLTGLLRFLRTPDHWEYKNGRLYVELPPGQTPDSHQIQARRRAWCINFNSQSWIIVRDFDLVAGAVKMSCNHCTLEHCRGRYMGNFTYMPNGAPNGAIGASSGDCGIAIKGNDNTIKHCRLAWSAGSGIVLDGRQNRIKRNIIRDMDYSGTYDCCLNILRGGDNLISFNTMSNAGRDVLQIHDPDADKIEFNDLSRAGLLCKDLGIIYTYGTNGRGTRIAYNWIHNNLATGHNHPGVYLDNGCSNFIVDHNVIWDFGKDAGVRVNGPCSGNRIINNTLFNCLPVGAREYTNPSSKWQIGWPRGVHYEATNNLYLGLHPDTELVDPAHDNFRLKPGAAATGAGKVVPGISPGIDNRAPDLGAYTTGGTYWIPGATGHR